MDEKKPPRLPTLPELSPLYAKMLDDLAACIDSTTGISDASLGITPRPDAAKAIMAQIEDAEFKEGFKAAPPRFDYENACPKCGPTCEC